MDIPRTLKNELIAERVIPFVGAGVSMAIRRKGTDDPLFPSWKELLAHAADRLDRESKTGEATYIRAALNLDDLDYVRIATDARKYLGPSWCAFLKEELNRERASVDDDTLILPRLLWELGGKLIITTNYDKVLRWSCPNPHDCETWNIQHKAEQSHFLARQEAEKPTVWHLHGSIEDASRIILTKDGYNLLYSDDSSKQLYAAALQTFRSILGSHTLLFVGCSFDDEQIGMQLRGISNIFEGNTGPHYALIKEDEKARLKGLISIEPLTFTDFGEPLRTRIESLIHCRSDRPHDIPQTASAPTPPTVAPSPARPNYHPANPVFYVPYDQKGSQVIGREDALAAVRRQLTAEKRTAIGHTASFSGLGGLGKTQLAVEYAHLYKDSYPNGVIWLNADQDIEAQLTKLAVDATWIAPESEHKDKLAVARQRLRSYGDCLFIFDNVEDQEVIQPYLLVPMNSHILITSRDAQTGFPPIPLDPLSPDHSLELLYQEARRNAVNAEEASAAREIVSILDGLPLAIELAGAYLCHRTAFSFAGYLSRLSDDPLKTLPTSYLSSFTGHDSDLYRTLKINEELCDEEPLLIPILDLLTWSGPAPMGILLMARLLEQKAAALEGALALGVELRIVQKLPDVDRYALHRLVREVRRVERPLSERMEWREQIAEKLGDWFQALREKFTDLPRFEAEFDHLIAWCDNCRDLPQITARLTWLQAYPPYHRGDYRKAHDIVTSALFFINENDVELTELHAHIYSDFGVTQGHIGNVNISLNYEIKALDIRRELFGDNHPVIVNSLFNIGISYSHLGKKLPAIDALQKALRIAKNVFPDKHPRIISIENNLRTILTNRGPHSSKSKKRR